MKILRPARDRPPTRRVLLVLVLLLLVGLVGGGVFASAEGTGRETTETRAPMPSAAVMGLSLLGSIVVWRSVQHWRKLRR